MPLPTSGLINSATINVELGRAANAPFSISGPTERVLAGKPSGKIMFSDFYGKANEFVVTIGSSGPVNMHALFSAETWASGITKRVIIPDGVTITGADQSVADSPDIDRSGGIAGVSGSATNPAGKVILENHGVIQGGKSLGGRFGLHDGKGGRGGKALHWSHANKLQLINHGIIRGGGGGGGAGGQGGAGFILENFIAKEPENGGPLTGLAIVPSHTVWEMVPSGRFHVNRLHWGGVMVLDDPLASNNSKTEYTVGIYTYFKGELVSTVSSVRNFRIWREFPAQKQIPTVGGNGGNGGNGAGNGTNNTGGTLGSAGGTNAGTGGSGGLGGEWGGAGTHGTAGTNGNASTPPLSGRAGVAGEAIQGIANVDIIENTGQIIGPQE
ncbi:hypothetical protein MP213Fo_04170 [Pseudochrobactrum sp. MP213Fo]